MDRVSIHPALGDNYIYLLEYAPGECLCVDPGDASVVQSALHRMGLKLTTILATHHHHDHIGGIKTLKQKTNCAVISSDASRIPETDRVIQDNEQFAMGEGSITVLATPGHTAICVSYFMTFPDEAPVLFSGDTLFIGGCGRLFECDAETMWHSLQRLAALPDTTRVYCGHEYTAENYAFAQSILPDDAALRAAQGRLQPGAPSVPSTLSHERQSNIFLRSHEAVVRAVVDGADWPESAVFARLRQRKDRF